MAKAPQRGRGRSSGRSGRPPKAKPAAAKPVKPAAARPVKPAAARPVKPAAAQPVKPAAASPVKPAAASPVKPAAKVSAAKASAKPTSAARSTRRGASEEEVGSRGSRSSRAAPAASGGMGFGAKVGLIVGLLTLVVAAVAVLVSSAGGDAEPDAVLNEIGYRSVGELAAIDPATWIGGGTKTKDGFVEFKRNFRKLFGEGRSYYFDDWLNEDADTDQWADMDQEEKADAQARLNELNETKQRLEGGGDPKAGPPPGAPIVLREIVRRSQPTDAPSGTQLLTVWVRKGKMKHKGEWAAGAGALKESQIQLDPANWMAEGAFHFNDGTFTDAKGTVFDVRVFATAHQTGKTTAYAAVWRDPEMAAAGSTGSGLGLGIAVIGALIAGFVASMLANNYTQGIRGLAREIDRLGTSGDATRHLHAHGPEAAALAKSVERMVGNLEFRAKHDDEDLDEVISKEEKVAAEIHGALMSKNPPQLSGYEVETLFKPGFEIGGDHFEYFQIDDSHLGVVLLDTNVRGVQAALVMAQAKAYLRAAAPHNLSPSDVLRRVNTNLAGELPAGRHVTALYCVIDTAEGKVSVASAGHLPLIVYRHSTGKVFKVNPEGIALGLDKGTVFDRSLEEGDIPLGVGDRIVLYTDGALMIQNDLAEEFGEQRFYQAVAKEAPKNSQAFVNFVGSAIDQYHLNAVQNDDITISTVKRLK